jgi:cytochrome c biogenesis protein CcdA
MSFDLTTPWGAVINGVLGIITRIIPDKQAAAAAQLQVLQLNQAGEFKEIEAQVQLAAQQNTVNAAEAAGGGYAAGWRPTIGYVCAAALAYYYVLHPVTAWALAIAGSAVKAPELVLDDHLWELMLGMLGLGGMRTWEKIKGAA